MTELIEVIGSNQSFTKLLEIKLELIVCMNVWVALD